MMSDMIKESWQFIVAAIGLIVFFIRHEGRTNFHGIEITRLQRQRDTDQEYAMKSREETHNMLRDMNAKLDRLIERNLK